MEKAIKTKWMNKRFANQWQRLHYRHIIGDMMYLAYKLQPTSAQDFFNKYTKDGERKVKDEKLRGRTVAELQQIARNYQKLCKDRSIKFEDFYNNVILHVIVESYEGYIKECSFFNYVKAKGLDIRKAPNNLDAEYGIDFVIYKDNKPKYAIQHKPISFIMGNRNQSLINDRISALYKIKKTKDKFNIPTAYVFYTKEREYMTNDNGNILFNLNKLVDWRGFTQYRKYNTKCLSTNQQN